MPASKDFEEHRVHIMRYQDRNRWLAAARRGNEAARLCQWAASKWMKGMATEPSACTCCDRVLSGADIPRAFLILVPTRRDPERVRATACAVCAECSRHDNQWLVNEGLYRNGLSRAEPRPGERLQ